jgi:1-acyl-sn-glycerol-3-phosphate acyltransferase
VPRIFGPVYYLGHLLSRVLFRLLGRWEVHGRENVPQTGGAVIAANHVSYLDPPAIGSGLKRTCYYMGKKELFQIPIFAQLIRLCGCFPVDREKQDKGAVRAAVNLLKAGNLLAIFPEGGRSPDGTLQQAGIGAALIANRAGVPIVPAVIRGTYQALPTGAKWVRRANISVTYGKPMASTSPDGKKANKERLQEITDRLMAEIARMQAEGLPSKEGRAEARTDKEP